MDAEKPDCLSRMPNATYPSRDENPVLECFQLKVMILQIPLPVLSFMLAP